MDGEKKINLIEGVPLNSTGAANIFLNAGKNTKVNSPNGAVIHLKTEKNSSSDVGLHINTTFSIASSKKIKFLFILNFLLSLICMIISCSVAFYYWNEIIAMRRQLDALKDQMIQQNFRDATLGQERLQQAALVSIRGPSLLPQSRQMDREPRVFFTKDEISPNARKYYVENLGDDVLLVDSNKKNPTPNKVPETTIPTPVNAVKELQVIHFNGADREINLGSKAFIGPWSLDVEVSSKESFSMVELNSDYVTIKESGLYMVYAQVVYVTHAPNCYFIWARQPGKDPRLLASCATADLSTTRPINKSQISCSVQTIARLYKDDTVNLAQREHNRTLWLRPGYSYFGFVKLSS